MEKRKFPKTNEPLTNFIGRSFEFIEKDDSNSLLIATIVAIEISAPHYVITLHTSASFFRGRPIENIYYNDKQCPKKWILSLDIEGYDCSISGFLHGDLRLL